MPLTVCSTCWFKRKRVLGCTAALMPLQLYTKMLFINYIRSLYWNVYLVYLHSLMTKDGSTNRTEKEQARCKKNQQRDTWKIQRILHFLGRPQGPSLLFSFASCVPCPPDAGWAPVSSFLAGCDWGCDAGSGLGSLLPYSHAEVALATCS